MTNDKLAWDIYQILKDEGIEIGTSVHLIKCVLDKADNERWIPVAQRLPEEGGRYLVIRSGGWYDIMLYDAAIKRFVIKDVTHWQPLPEGPEATE